MSNLEPQRSSRITSTIDHQYGYRFELDPTENDYEVKFAKATALLALAEHKPIEITDFGCGNGDMTYGIIQQMLDGGYNGNIRYVGFDLDQKGIDAAKTKLATIPAIDASASIAADLRDVDKLKGRFQNLSDSSLNVLLFCDSLHWLKPEEIRKLLQMLYSQFPTGSRLLATVCSVWNTTSIGSADNPHQKQHIAAIQKLISDHPSEPLGRDPDQIEYKTAMTHFTDLSLTDTFSKAGFTVKDCRYSRNIFFPNGLSDLPECVNLTAFK
jgi:SAM-dependent methyltransferase